MTLKIGLHIANKEMVSSDINVYLINYEIHYFTSVCQMNISRYITIRPQEGCAPARFPIHFNNLLKSLPDNAAIMHHITFWHYNHILHLSVVLD